MVGPSKRVATVRVLSGYPKLLSRHRVSLTFCATKNRLCEGGDLLETIATQHKLNEQGVLSIMKQILLAVAYCHKKNIVHRDIKPENILFSEKGKVDSAVKVIDFGRSKILKYQQKISELAGSVCVFCLCTRQ